VGSQYHEIDVLLSARSVNKCLLSAVPLEGGLLFVFGCPLARAHLFAFDHPLIGEGQFLIVFLF
jgi:hypothetical protein